MDADLPIVKRLERDCDQVTVGDMWFAAGLIKRLYGALERVTDAYGFDPSIDSSIWQEVQAGLRLARGETVNA